jgi:hypothetical protein
MAGAMLVKSRKTLIQLWIDLGSRHLVQSSRPIVVAARVAGIGLRKPAGESKHDRQGYQY